MPETATERVAAIIERLIRREEGRDDDEFIGHDWWQINEFEIEVFGLQPSVVRRVAVVWGAYQQTLGADDHFGELDAVLLAALRAEQPFLQRTVQSGMPELTWSDFVTFGGLFGCDHRSCLAWYWKTFFHEDRRGLHDWS